MLKLGNQNYVSNGTIEKFQDPTVLFLCFRIDRFAKTVQTQIRLILEEQSDQGLHCLESRLHHSDELL